MKLHPSARGLIVASVPTDVTVLVDAQPRGKSFGQGTPEYADAAKRAGVALEQMSAPLLLERLAPGRHVLTFQKPCFESTDVAVDVALDAEGPNAPLRLEPIKLNQSIGTLEVKGPAKAQVVVDGTAAGAAPLSLPGQCAGKRRVQVKLPGAGQWLGDVDVRANTTTSINPPMRITLAFVGVARADAAATAPPVGEKDLTTTLQTLTSYNVVAPAAGLPDTMLLRAAGGGDPLTKERIAEVAAATGADILVDAVPAEGAFEQKLRLTIRSIHYGFKETLQVDPDDPKDAQILLKRLEGKVALSAPWLGLDLIEVERAPNPLVLSVAAGGPAATAGVKPGDAIVAVAGGAVASPLDAAKATSALREGSQISISVQSPGGAPRQVNVKVASAPVMVRGAATSLCPPVLAEIMSLRAKADPAVAGQPGVERTSALLTLADLLMRSNQPDAALAAALANLQLADGPGLSAGTVDYLRGSCLLKLGRKADAAEALKRAARSQDSRLWAQDGPPVAERAERLLESIR